MPASRFASARAIIMAMLRGQLRAQYYSDVYRFGDAPDATRQVAAGYICLAGSLGWIISAVATLIANPQTPESPLLALVNCACTFFAFYRIKQRADPRPALDWVVLLNMLTIVIVAYRHSGIVAPLVTTLPIMAGVAALYQRPKMRPVTVAMGLAVAIFALVAALGIVGTPTTYAPRGLAIMTLVGLLAVMLALGGIAWISILARDYSLDQLRIANDAIVSSATRARVALESARVGLWDVPDAAKPYFAVSESFQSITGYSGPEFDAIFGNLPKFVHGDDVDPLRRSFAISREHLSRIRIDFRLLTKTRGYRWFSAHARYNRNADGTMRISGSLQDINFVKTAEEALRTGRDQARAANKAKADFIATMSHEVRTPLNAILGAVEVLKRGRHDTEAADMIGLIDDAGGSLLAIVNDLLDVSRMDADKLEIVPAPTDVGALVRRTVEFWGPQARDKGLTLRIDTAKADDAPLLMLDAGRVRQVVGNLLSNAIKFTERGVISTEVSVREGEGGRFDAIISVIDSGPGVHAAAVESIFEAFQQEPGKASFGGAGLGLFISRRLARMMTGDLTLETAQGGAHFRLTLTAAHADPGARYNERSVEENVAQKAGAILCVDDNERNRRIIQALLGKIGFDVTLCASGAEAVDLCALRTFDVILMDIVMPNMDGPETLAQLRRDLSGLNCSTPVIALTAKLSPEDFDAYRIAGFDGVAAKPINVADLLGEIARIAAARA